ncbi:response regulator [Pseudenhygromyxa sp. WMMC2535]|uniref:response regulator n=1 Tax=Pseudenhygromyxa sp. WMMC2535 TaxID=2712867 RepID=UPI001557AE8F|nr:response regulator [Pseudenhygromyxa sp. WMMC2535]NVB38245.1 response regulator [Pseudenhygromyxa sp. WMMC2535]
MTEEQPTPLILVVDDSEIVLELVADSLEEAGFGVETCSQPLGVTSLVARLRPDVVVLDIGMPALGGSTLVEIIHRNRVHDCPMLLYTDRSRTELAATIRACGADGGALKSEDSSELVDVIRSVLASRRR